MWKVILIWRCPDMRRWSLSPSPSPRLSPSRYLDLNDCAVGKHRDFDFV